MNLDEYLVRHTPGPWYPGRTGGSVCSVHPPEFTRDHPGDIRFYGGYLVCESAANQADAALMTAAPDMYALLHKLHDWLVYSATGQQAVGFQKEIEILFCEVRRMGGRT